MNVSRAVLTMLRDYGVTDVFGLPGETTLPFYREWESFEGVAYHMCRDERNGVFMADGYARATGKVGVCEGPSVGATHMVPGVTEAYKGCVPLIVMTSDVPLSYERRNMLTSFDQTALFAGITKESLTAHAPCEVPHLLRRAFRLAATGRPGPVHLRLPSDVLEGDVDDGEVWSQPRFGNFPSIPFRPGDDDVAAAAERLLAAERPLVICGQGALHSGAWQEVRALAEALGVPVGTTISGKGIFPETHPLSLGVIGARGGRCWSNAFVTEADVILFVGSSTDSAGTAGWTLPPRRTKQTLIQIDVGEGELGNNYDVLPLYGDAALTLEALVARLPGGGQAPERGAWLRAVAEGRRRQEERLEAHLEKSCGIDALAVIRALERQAPRGTFFAVDPGLSAVYSAAFLRLKEPGRRMAYNFAMGALGYAIPAAIGARFGVDASRPVVALVGDGSFGFAAGELETAARLGAKVLFVVFDNRTFGWIRGTEFALRKEPLKASFGRFTDFRPVDYVKVAEGFGIEAFRVERREEIDGVFARCLKAQGPCLVALPVEVQDRFLPPVPGWAECASALGMESLY